jgi:arylsulfatase A
MKNLFIALLLTIVFTYNCIASNKSKPNIIIIYADDLGYADISCYGAVGVQTPNIDRLAENGIKFTDAHSPAATCTPSRYSLLTGSYAFRNDAKILPGDAPLLIQPGTSTIAGMLQKEGYKTAVVGKWHLGLGNGNLNWNEEIKPGPVEVGFNYSFIIPATGDRVPCVFVENHNVVGLEKDDPLFVDYNKKIGNLPTGLSNPEMLKMPADTQHSCTIINGISRIGYMEGGEKAWWVDERFPDVLTGKAIKFIEDNRTGPFFLYLAFHDIHVPRSPNPRFVGKSSMGPRGDAIVQLDWCTGQIIKKLEELGLEKNTLVIFTSDNGPILNDGYSDQAVEKVGKHKPGGPYRGAKYSIFEAGTRIPAIVYWPGVVKSSVSDALWSQVDLYASIAGLVNYKLDEKEAPDSYNVLDALLGRSENGRETMLEEAFSLAVREGKWKYIAPVKGTIPAWMANKGIEPGLSHEDQLYNLSNDVYEKNNLKNKRKDKLEELKKKLNYILENKMTR